MERRPGGPSVFRPKVVPVCRKFSDHSGGGAHPLIQFFEDIIVNQRQGDVFVALRLAF